MTTTATIKKFQAPAALLVRDAELRVLTHLAAGATNSQAAKALGLSLNTVKSHLRNATLRTGAASTTHLVVMCVRAGLLRPLTPLARTWSSPTRQRLAQIYALRDALGDSRDVNLAPAHAALDDVITAYEDALDRITTLNQLAPTQACPLSPTELTSLICAANGETRDDEASHSDVTAAGIGKRRELAKRALGVSSLPHAVAVALISGWITRADIHIPEATNDVR